MLSQTEKAPLRRERERKGKKQDLRVKIMSLFYEKSNKRRMEG
jgi:hypothetical protein